MFVPLELATDTGTLTFLSTVPTFAAPADVTLAELVIESFFPADQFTATALRAAADAGALRRHLSAGHSGGRSLASVARKRTWAALPERA